jgi:hypothetical protein
MIIGVNIFQPGDTFYESDLLAIGKPPAGTDCPDPNSLEFGIKFGLTQDIGRYVFSPVPANGIDDCDEGVVIARNQELPTDRLWIYRVTRNPVSGRPVFGEAQPLAVASYAVPPDARQSGSSKLLDTGDASPIQAVLARNPARGNAFSLWTQHTIAVGAVSGIRWYEINPFSAPPAVRRTGRISDFGVFVYNAAISPDRRVDGAVSQFGDSFVIGYTRSGGDFLPGFRVRSSAHGGALAPLQVKNGENPYFDFSCHGPPVCRWGEYSTAAPDPRPGTTGAGVVWASNQYSGFPNNCSSETACWGTWIAAIKP